MYTISHEIILWRQKELTLKEVRENKGLTVRELSSQADVSLSFIYNAESGAKVSKVKVVKLCKVLGVDINTITGLNLK